MSSLIISSQKDDIQQQCCDQDDYCQHLGTFIPDAIFSSLVLSKCVDQANQLLVLVGPRCQAHEDRDQEAGGPGKDCGPEVLRHLAGIKMHNREPAAFDSRHCSGRNGQTVMEGCGCGTGKKSG